MTRTARFLTLAALAAVLTPLCATPAPTLTILVEDLAETDEQVLADTIGTASVILSKAGVAASWELCPPAGPKPESCRAEPGPWMLRLRMLPEEKARLLPLAENNFGVALPGDRGALGSLAFVFVERTRRHARKIRVAEAVLLGHIVAHELGHLLLGESSHAASGIMTARFKARHLQAVGQGGMGFHRGQAKAMEAQVGRRLARRPGAQDAL